MTSGPGSEPEVMLEEIDQQECASLVGATRYGRIAVIAAGRPHIVVLNHVVLPGNVLFRVAADNRLVELTEERPIHAVYEVDSVLPAGRYGWSVIVHGVLRREFDPEETATARAQLDNWAGGRREVVLRLQIHRLTGRRVGVL